MENSIIKMSVRKKEQKENLNKIFDMLFDSINAMGSEVEHIDIISDLIVSKHRTLQSSFWTIMFGIMDKYGKTENTDARNEYAVEACKKIAQFIKDNNLYIPFI